MSTGRTWALTAAAALLWAGAASSRLMGAATPAAPALAPPPRLLSETGLYADIASYAIDPRNRPFSPQYPLWSDGAAKRRWVRLPEGATIDTRALDHWDFPVGTRFWKEFQFGGRRVETRFLVKDRADHWTFASYAWADDQRDATLAPAAGIADVAEVAPGRFHGIPAEAECRACHDSDRTEILGFTALQLSDDRDPLAPHAESLAAGMVTLRTLVAEQRLAPARTELVTSPPRVRAANERERAVLGYLSTNCGACHNRRSSIASVGLSLKYTIDGAGGCTPDAIATAVDQPGHWVVPTAADGTSRVVAPGRPELSALLQRARSRRPSSQMPPIGTVVPDREALAMVSAWIASMPAARPRARCNKASATR